MTENEVTQKFPSLTVLTRKIENISVSTTDPILENLKTRVSDELRNSFKLESLKDEPVFRAYRNFFWQIGIDPTKIRPAAEALIRRVLNGKPLPRINTAVDAYNLASMVTRIALAAFDLEKIEGGITMRFSRAGESFLGIGMDKPLILTGAEIVMADASRLIAIYPHRDADYSRTTLQTKNVMLISCGVPGISPDQLKEAAEKASEFVVKFCGGTIEGAEH